MRPIAPSTPYPWSGTKLQIPSVPADLVSRPRLVERLHEGTKRKLTLISAPAGSGKTTLVSQWCASGQRAGHSIAWVSLDESDNDPARFWDCVAGALDLALPAGGVDSLDLLHFGGASTLPGMPAGLLHGLASLSHDVVLVLDDYHVIVSEPIHRGITYLLDHLPPYVHLMILTRADPAMPLARRRARGDVLDVRGEDLRFTPGEAEQMMTQLTGLSLPAAQVAALTAKTEGWAVGLQLVGLSLQRRNEALDFVTSFTASNRFVLDYLMEEVFSPQSERIQQFLLQTSLLERLSGPLCDAVTGGRDGQAALDYLARANLFTVPLDEDGFWYRYHSLFANLLRHRLHQTAPESAPELHRRASAWYEANRLIGEAVEHALAGGDQERAARLMEQVGWDMLSRFETVTLSRWLDTLPDEFVRVRPQLRIFQAWTQVWAIHLEGAEKHLDDAEGALQNLPGSAGNQRLLGEIAGIRACIAIGRIDVTRSIELFQEAFALLPEGSAPLRGVLLANLGAAYWLADDLTEASRKVAGATAVARAIDDAPLAIRTMTILGNIRVAQGKLREALGLYQDSLHVARQHGLATTPCGIFAHWGIGLVLLEFNDLEEARRHLTTGIALCQRGENPKYVAQSYATLARSELALGHWDAARIAIETSEQVAPDLTSRSPLLLQSPKARVLLHVMQGDLDAAWRWAQANTLRAEDDVDCLRECLHLPFARLLIALGRQEPQGRYLRDAQSLLERTLRTAEAAGRLGSVIEILVLHALVMDAQAGPCPALASLKRALAIAESEGYVRLFLDEGEPMLRLLRQALNRGISPGYAGKLISAFTASPVWEPAAGSSAQDAAGPSATLLSDRELDVLRMIDSGLCNKEIAEALVIAVSTVKWHINNIFSKLDVQTRSQALARARELQLL